MRSAILTTPHADDIAGFKATCLVTKSMADRPGADPSYGQTSRDDQVAASPPVIVVIIGSLFIATSRLLGKGPPRMQMWMCHECLVPQVK